MTDLDKLIEAVELQCMALRENAHRAGKEGKGTHRNAGDSGRVAALWGECCRELEILKAHRAQVQP